MVNQSTFKNVMPKVSSPLLKQMLVAMSCNMFCLITGCTFGFTAVLLPQIKKDDEFPYSDTYDSWIASSSCLAMAVGCFAGGLLSDRYGRRLTHLIVAMPFLAGWIVLAFAKNVPALLIGRVLTGLSSGVFRSLGAIYLGEIVSPIDRPAFIFTLSVSGNSGILFIHILTGYLSWRLSCFIVCLPVLLGIGLQVLAKESPLWFMSKGKIGKGTQAFRWFRGTDECSQKELAEILEKQKDRPPESTFKDCLRAACKAFLLPLFTVICLSTTVQFSGVNTMSFFAQDLLESTFSGQENSFMVMLITDSTRVFGVFIMFAFSKYIPRRKSYFIICGSLLLLLIALIVYTVVQCNGLAWLAITILMVYMALGSMMAGLSWTFVGEIFPSTLRGLGSGIGAGFSFFLLFISVNITPGIMMNHGIIATYATFAVVTFLGLILLYFLRPQTDGKTLQQIENDYSKK